MALLRFSEPTENGVKYEFRLLLVNRENEITGNGAVFEKYEGKPGTSEGEMEVIDKGSQLVIHAGPIELPWSQSNRRVGFVYYVPERMHVEIACVEDFRNLDLRRFLR